MDLEEVKGNLKNFINSDGKLTAIPAKRKLQVMAISFLAEKFEKGKEYTEKEVGEIINANTVFEDAATIRRGLIAYKFMTRDDYCKNYRLLEKEPDIDKMY